MLEYNIYYKYTILEITANSHLPTAKDWQRGPYWLLLLVLKGGKPKPTAVLASNFLLLF
jgi:hypothetical protein